MASDTDNVCVLLLEMVEQNRELLGQNQSLLEQNQSLTEQVTTLATRVALLEEQKGRSSRNSSKPHPATDLANAALVELDPAAARATASVASGAASKGIRALAVICCLRSVAMR